MFSNNLKLEDCREKRKRLSFKSSISLFSELNLSARIANGETESKRNRVLGKRRVKSRRWLRSVEALILVRLRSLTPAEIK